MKASGDAAYNDCMASATRSVTSGSGTVVTLRHPAAAGADEFCSRPQSTRVRWAPGPPTTREADMPSTRPCLWFDHQALEAAEFYTSVFPNSSISTVTRYPQGTDREGEVLTVAFELDGVPYLALDGGPEFSFSEAVSFEVQCADQAEIDRYWEALAADGGEHGPCGWLKDRFGLSWQVVPSNWEEIAREDEPEKYAKVFAAMMTMGKLDIAALEAARQG
jgi:predicted 3-demethylubiquinone-9 3-methyltransferase (glyoxalase superfamily)